MWWPSEYLWVFQTQSWVPVYNERAEGTKLSSRFQEVKTITHHSRTCGPARIPSWAGAVAWRAASPRVPLWPRRWPPRWPGKGCRRQRAPGGGPCSGSDQHRRISAAAWLLASRPLEQDYGIMCNSGVPRGRIWGVPPPPKFRSFDTVEPDYKLSRKYLVFLFQHPN